MVKLIMYTLPFLALFAPNLWVQFTFIKAELKKEKTRTLTSWKNREDNYEKMIDSTREIYVDIRRMLGDASIHIPEIDE